MLNLVPRVLRGVEGTLSKVLLWNSRKQTGEYCQQEVDGAEWEDQERKAVRGRHLG